MDQLVAQLVTEFEIDEATARQDVTIFVDDLDERGLLV